MKEWYDDIADNPELGKLWEAQMKKYFQAMKRWKAGTRKQEPDWNEMLGPHLHRDPEGFGWDWDILYEKRQNRIRAEVKRELNSMPIPAAASTRFQDFMKNQLNAKDAFADFIALPDSKERLLTYLKRVATTQVDGCKQLGGMPTVLMAHQAVVFAMAKLRVMDRIRTPGLLAMHSTGAGKTLEGLCAILAFWNKKDAAGRPWAIFSVSTRGNQRSNSLEKLSELAGMFSQRFMNEIEGIDKWPFRGKTPKDIEKTMRLRLRMGLASVAANREAQDRLIALKRDDVISYTQLAHDCNEDLFTRRKGARLHHCLIIIDEIQFLLHPPADETSLAGDYRDIKQVLKTERDTDTTWVLGMTATPGSTFREVCEVMQVIKGNDRAFRGNVNLAVEARGLVSVAQVEGDLNHFPKLSPTVKCVRLTAESAYARKYIRGASQYPAVVEGLRDVAEDLVMSQEERAQNEANRYAGKMEQYRADLAVWKRSKQGDEPKEPKPTREMQVADDPKWTYTADKRFHFYKRLRELSNYLLLRGPEGDMQEKQAELAQEKVWSYLGKDLSCKGDDRLLFVLSPKLRAIVERIEKDKGKHFVYTSDTMTLLLLATALENRLGMHQVKMGSRGKPVVDAGKTYFGIINKVTSVRKLTGLQRTDYPLNKWEYVSSPDKHIKAVKAAINDPVNLEGSNVKVTLATKENYKGVDLKALRYIHLVEPMPDFADFIQLVGRGPRFCSHAGLEPMTKRTVHLIAYRLVVKGIEDFAQADTHVYNESIRRYSQEYGLDTDRKLQEASVDYLIFRNNLHKTSGQQREQLMDLVCDRPARPKPAAKAYKMSPERKAGLRQKAERQKALIAQRKARGY